MFVQNFPSLIFKRRCGLVLSSKVVSELNLLFSRELAVTTKLNSEKGSGKWFCSIRAVQIGEYMIVPLTSPRDVKSEGYMMKNCVREYIHLCKDGKYLLFSIRNSLNERIATLGVERRDNRWYFDECLGEENSVVMETTVDPLDANNYEYEIFEYTEMFSVAHEIVRLLNRKGLC
jgi:hypothetical protein